jgi:hypothetical protein
MRLQNTFSWLLATSVCCALAHAQPLITRERESSYTVRLHATASPEPTPRSSTSLAFPFDRASISLPFVGSTSSHTVNAAGASAHVWFNGHRVEPNPVDVTDGPAPDLYIATCDLPIASLRSRGANPRNDRSETITLGLSFRVIAADTVYDEAAALDIPWPTRLPSDIALFAAPDEFIASDHPEVVALLNAWTLGRPRSVPPALLAKHLASEVLSAHQLHGDFLAQWPNNERWRGRLTDPCDPRSLAQVTPRAGWPSMPVSGIGTDDLASMTFRGFDISSTRLRSNELCFAPRILEPIQTGRANDAVMTNLYAALLRASGIPARVIVGFSFDETDWILATPRRTINGIEFSGERAANNPVPRVWVEFYLFDDRTDRGEWVPVDLARQKRETSTPPPIDRPWRYFGNHDDFHRTVPFSPVYDLNEAERPDWIPALWRWKTDPALDAFIDTVFQARVTERDILPGGRFRPPAHP